jgi:hypothetical protein
MAWNYRGKSHKIPENNPYNPIKFSALEARLICYGDRGWRLSHTAPINNPYYPIRFRGGWEMHIKAGGG